MNRAIPKPKILVTPRSVTREGHPSLQRLEAAGFDVVFSAAGKQPGAEELKALLPGCVGWLAGVEPVTDEILAGATSLRVISRNGVGVDNIDLAAAGRRGIKVMKAVGANARGVAELTLAHLLALSRWVTFSDAAIKRGDWERRKGFELAGRTLGVVGCGHIGRIVTKLALGFDMKVLACDLFPDCSFAPSPDFRFVTLTEVFRGADVVTLHCPALPDHRPLIDAAALAQMKRGVCLINTARADLIDSAALEAALQSGQVAGAALDVFQAEPPTGDPLVARDRVIATPHIGGFTDESVDRAVELAVVNLLSGLGETTQREPAVPVPGQHRL